MNMINASDLRAEIASRATRGTDWEHDLEWVARQVRSIERRQAIRTFFAACLELLRRTLVLGAHQDQARVALA
jgi:hypothetical protein